MAEEGLNDQLVSLVTDLVRREVDALFTSRDAAIATLTAQVQTLISDVERITAELEARAAWNRPVVKYELSPVKALESPTRKKPPSFQRLPSLLDLADDAGRSEDGKLLFAKNLPRVASIDKQTQRESAQLKQKAYEAAVTRYPECRSTVFAPSSFNPARSTLLEPPAMTLQLHRATGYHPSATSNVLYLASGEVVWCTAMLVVMYAKRRQAQRFYSGHTREITALGLHPNQTTIASGQCGKDAASILVWDAVRAKDDPNHILATLRGQTVHIKSISSSHDGKLVASLGGDLYNSICIHEWQEETLLVKIRGHSSKVHMLAFNPYQAYGIPDKTKTLVAPAKNGKRAKYAVELHAQPGQALRDDDACYTLVSCGVQHIKFWTLTQTEYVPPVTAEKEDSAFYGSSFGGPNRMRQLTPHEKVWKLEGNPPLMKSDPQDFTYACFCNDMPPLQIYDEGSDQLLPSPTAKETSLGRPRKMPLYAAHVADQAIVPRKWWELPVTDWQLQDDTSALMQHLHFEPTAKLVEIVPHDVATGNKFKVSRHTQAELADLTQRLALKPDAKSVLDRMRAIEYKGPLAHTALCSHVASDGKRNRVASVGYDGLVHIWSLHLVEPMRVPGTHTLGEYAPIGGAASSSDGRHRLQLEVSLELPVKAKPASLSIQGDALLVGLANHSIYECILTDNGDEAETDWVLLQEGVDGAVVGGAIVDDTLVTVSTDQSLRWWSLPTHECLGRIGLRSMGTCVDAQPSTADVAVGCASGELLILNATDNMAEKRLIKVVATDAITVVKISPDAKYIAVGGKDNCVYLVDTTNYKRVAKCEGHATYVAHMDWSVDGYLLQTNAADGEVLYWQVTPGPSLRQITDAILMRDILWHRWSCVYGWPVQGIWGDDASACTDILSVCPIDVPPNDQRAVAADVHHVLVGHRSSLRSFRWPCLRSSPYHIYDGHAGSITAVLGYSQDGIARVLTLGGADSTILEWRALPSTAKMVEATIEEEAPHEATVAACDDDDDDDAVTPVRPAQTPDRRTPRTPRVKDDAVRETSPATIACRRAKFDFAGEHDDELSFRAGEVVRLLDKRPGDWWYGETCNGQKGIFPSDHVDDDDDDGLVA
ncbi:hypothetical protein SPRG_04855 [Saprolegnia parasitica CBS 223.65]|uniref:SH3 domain-containing protein n=1 Tax=Saprolegnia parasitica (strain CBS 223.65) TaxID=695850 RepID=A0A067CGY7_SAPPC|nr:hypothetical protein SPRG_04855 [Saprolegnia parasitica CBS 223.65]KDO29738.1 hypothetical protein SPRG_04855 [Saprolegnia parasitica CBS 223.65]|eukprot:XP_012199387.1 hypothetical protein SPRG_04855 [Saprolegnia parasitica CBS 223.65]